MILLLGGCANKENEKPLVISTDIWIGASLLYHAHHEGWLEENNMQMLQAGSINENMRVFESGASDIFTGTQHEYKRQIKKFPDLIPVIVYDRSFGGDIIMSNRTKEGLQETDEDISVYLESESVSEELLNYFIEYNQIDRNKMKMYNRSQEELALMTSKKEDGPIIIVTYSPHDLKLAQNGFLKIASSKDDGYYVIDAVYVSKNTLETRSDDISQLKKILERSFAAYNQDPKAFYEVVKPYLGNPSYEEFEGMRKNIKWMDDAMDEKIVKWMEKIHFPKEHLEK